MMPEWTGGAENELTQNQYCDKRYQGRELDYNTTS